MHAETVEDVLAVLQAPPLQVPDHLLGRLTVVVNLQLIEGVGATPLYRRPPGPSRQRPARVDITCLARWDRATDSVQHYFRDDPAVLAALSRWMCLPGCRGQRRPGSARGLPDPVDQFRRADDSPLSAARWRNFRFSILD